MFFCEFGEFFKNTFFTEHLRTTASAYCLFSCEFDEFFKNTFFTEHLQTTAFATRIIIMLWFLYDHFS